MVVRKKRKSVRMRGSKTHGYGSMKKHRGSGHRGGKGMAGSGKKADSKKPSVWKNPYYFGKRGFTSRKKLAKRVIIMTLSDLERSLAELVKNEYAREADGLIHVDLTAAGVDRLLGSGQVMHAFAIRVPHVTPRAREKIEAAGGKILTDEEAGE